MRKGLGSGSLGQVNAALGFIDQEIRQGRFPPVVNPEPICGRDPDLIFESFIDVERELVGLVG
jgi:hypothetical protein